jgi:hypothetical protein
MRFDFEGKQRVEGMVLTPSGRLRAGKIDQGRFIGQEQTDSRGSEGKGLRLAKEVSEWPAQKSRQHKIKGRAGRTFAKCRPSILKRFKVGARHKNKKERACRFYLGVHGIPC